MNPARRAYDLALIIPTEGEFADIRACIPFKPLQAGDGDYWYEFPVPGGRTGIARVLFTMGLTETAATATRMLQAFQPELLVMLGIGGGLDPDLRLGDVVVGDTVQQYMKAARSVPGPALFHPAGDAHPLPERLRRYVANFPYFNEAEYEQWGRSARMRALDGDVPVASTPGSRREPACLLLPIASGDIVVADTTFRDWLLSHDRKRGVIEMEAAGAASAVTGYDKDVALLVIRGISDFADDRKNALDTTVTDQPGGVWRRYAVQNAAEMLITYLASPRFPWRRPAQLSVAEWEALTRHDGGGRAGFRTAAPSGWDYFTRVAHAVEVAGAAAGIYSAVKSAHHHDTTPAPSPSTDHDQDATHHHHHYDDQV